MLGRIVYRDGGSASSRLGSFGVLADVGTADRDRHDLRAAGLDCGARLVEVLVLAGSDEET